MEKFTDVPERIWMPHDSEGPWFIKPVQPATEYTRANLSPSYAKVRGALRDLLDAFDEHVAIPDRNCSCHLAPPCEDCVTWSFARDAVETARAALRDLGEKK